MRPETLKGAQKLLRQPSHVTRARLSPTTREPCQHSESGGSMTGSEVCMSPSDVPTQYFASTPAALSEALYTELTLFMRVFTSDSVTVTWSSRELRWPSLCPRDHSIITSAPPPAGSQGNMLMILLTSHAVTDSDHLFAHSLGRQTHLVVYVHCITLAKAPLTTHHSPLTTHHSPSPVSALGLRAKWHTLSVRLFNSELNCSRQVSRAVSWVSEWEWNSVRKSTLGSKNAPKFRLKTL